VHRFRQDCPGDEEQRVTTKRSGWLGATLTGCFAALVIAATASAHVHVDVDGEAVAGERARLVFEVPNERDDAATVAVEVQLPSEAVLTDVAPAEVDGWTVTTTTRDGDIVDTIRWDATGAGLTGDASAALEVAVGPLPAVDSLAFPTVQTYDDGDVVRWIEPVLAGQPEPDLPVPTLAIAAAPPDDTTTPTDPVTTDATGRTDPTVPTAGTPAAATAPPTGAVATDVAAPQPTVVADDVADDEVDDDDGSAVWPWVMVVVVVVVVGGGVAMAIARRRASG
jgi:uncharacterized protein